MSAKERHAQGMSLQIKFWGVRGSLPSSPMPERWVRHFESLLEDFLKSGHRDLAGIKTFLSQKTIPETGGYGTATTCVEAHSQQTQIIIDAGSGLRNLGEQMMKGPAGKGQAEIHIFLTHFHWDHLLGIPFFAPHFIKGNRIHYYAVQPDLEEMVKIKFRKPLFPVSFESLPSSLHFHRLEARKTIQIRDMAITPYQLDHPDPCWGYRVEAGGKSYAHCVDTEGTRSSREALGPDLPLYVKADLMYFDAQYTLPELVEKANWGHSAAQIGLEIAFRESIKNVIFAHHDPGADVKQIQALKDQTDEYYRLKVQEAAQNNTLLPKVHWQYAYEGLVIDLSSI